MTLKEKFENIEFAFPADESEIIADEFAIGFAEWVIHNYSSKGKNHEDKWLYSEKPGPIGWSIESLLEIYKKENGL